MSQESPGVIGGSFYQAGIDKPWRNVYNKSCASSRDVARFSPIRARAWVTRPAWFAGFSLRLSLRSLFSIRCRKGGWALNTETFGVLIFVFVVFGLFYFASVKAEKWVKQSYEEKRRAEPARSAVKGKR